MMACRRRAQSTTPAGPACGGEPGPDVIGASGRGFSALVKADLRQLDEGAGPVRQPQTKRWQAMFLDAGHFAESARVSIRPEHRIVAEAGSSARRPHQRSLRVSLDFLKMIVGPCDAKCGNEMRLALRR